MLKAGQGVLIHQTNMQIVNIRTMELNFYNKVMANFGTLCALIIGFILNSVSNSDISQFTRNLGSRVSGDIYFICSALSMACGLYCVQQSILSNVYGLGLALRGPIGSMVFAVDGMIQEQYGIVLTFILTIIFFGLSTIAYFWVVETTIIASVSTVIMTTGFCYWYYYSTRIINRFKLTDEKIVWDDEDDVTIKIHPSLNCTPTAEGYLTKKDISFTKDLDNPWVRKYFLLDKNLLYYYENKAASETYRTSPLNHRPIRISGYEVKCKLSSPFTIRLLTTDEDDDRREWEFRCDTLEETNMWSEAFQNASIVIN